MHVPYNYLPMQFADYSEIAAGWDELIRSSEFTLGAFMETFEREFAEYVGARHCVATNNGTDALILSLKALGIGPGDEVITPCNSFYATTGAVVAVGATPVFCDVDDRYQADLHDIADRITKRTKVLLPVHWAGASPDMEAITTLAEEHGLEVLEDACMAIGGRWGNRHPGTFGKVGAFSMHPLKTLNVMGDGGMVITDSEDLYVWMLKYRNHGMVDRDHIEFWGVNYRLQPLQAIVASTMLRTLDQRLIRRREIQQQLDAGLDGLAPGLVVPPRDLLNLETVSLYMVLVEHRDGLLDHLVAEGVEAKVHYPVPLHLQQAAAPLGFGPGSMPVAERQADALVTLPAHEYLVDEQVAHMISSIRRFEAT